MSLAASLPTDLRESRLGDQADLANAPLFVVLAEFDIDKGSVVRIQLPYDVPVSADNHHLAPSSPLVSSSPTVCADVPHWGSYLADQLLPDGTERFDFAVSWFILNRPPSERRWSCIAAKYCLPPGGGDWICAAQWCSVSVMNSSVVMSDCRGVEPVEVRGLRTLTFHPMPSAPKGSEHLFAVPRTQLEAGDVADLSTEERALDRQEAPVFVMLRDRDDVTGLLFHNAMDFEAFSARVESNAANAQARSGELGGLTPERQLLLASSDDGPMYGVSCTMTKKDASVRRGSINKGVAVISSRLDWLAGSIPALQCAVEACCCIYGWTAASEDAQRKVMQTLHDHLSHALVPKVSEMTASLRDLSARLVSDSEDANRTTAIVVSVDRQDYFSHVPPREGSGRSPGAAPRESPSAKPAAATMLEAPDDGAQAEDAGDASSPTNITSVTPVNYCPSPVSASPRGGQVKLVARPLDLPVNVVMQGPVLLDLYDCLGADMLKVFVASLADKRIMFIARHLVATKVSGASMAVGVVMESFYPHFIASRVFPYSGITSTQHFESRLGYIFGTLNPIFESTKPKRWWDLSVDLEKKLLTVADPELSLLWELMAPAMLACNRRLAALVGRAKAFGRMDHSAVERHARLEVRAFIDSCIELATSMPSIATKCKHLLCSQAAQMAVEHGLKRRGERRWAAELQLAAASGEWNTLVSVMQRGLRHCATPEGLHHMLYQMPQWSGGLNPIGELLFHSDSTVVLLAVAMLRRIDADPAGRRCVSRLNNFFLFAFEQLKQEMPETDT